ncbi:DUF4153 domain-containing protein [Paenibacillus xylaniclasticus]|uniref:DUF4153 domain-containing protein n=1 Tax=Paenibacillus xylaniclasticus TaxID=588083 RepID=UPI000FD957D6|nr:MULTISPECIES: DUF4153 domain-containing protein [Paenibacillus]GFN34109.1 DUF4153 domain-containing protein [Paenibacillus curdlanolyticus]
MEQHNPIMACMDSPRELERLYRREPELFKRSFLSAWERNPESKILAVWNERLYFQEVVEPGKALAPRRDFVIMGVLAVLAGISARAILYFTGDLASGPVNLVMGVLLFMAALFMYKNVPRKEIILTVGSLFAISGVYLNLLPLQQEDSTLLVYLHLPVLLWALLGLAFTGNQYRESDARLAFLKFNGEISILYASMAISGMLLSLLTLRLFSLAGLEIEEFYFRNVVVFGAAALAIVAAYLISGNLKLARNIVPYLARIFSPLVLVTLLVYVVTAIGIGSNPFQDRNFLMSFNGILVVVLAVSVFSITERGTDEKKNLSDYINGALIVLALILNTVALLAIAFRLSSYGITPNRCAVLGANLLIWSHLIWIMLSYVRFLQNKTGPAAIQSAVTKYLPIYGVWAAVVTFTFPFLF